MADQVIVVNPDQQQRQQMIEDMKRLKEHPLDRGIEGGYFLDYPGAKTAHNANGEPVPFRSEESIRAEVAGAVKAEAEATEAAPAEAPKAKAKGRK